MDFSQVIVYTVHHTGDTSGFSENLGLTPLADGLYRVEHSSVVDESIRYGDVISATTIGELEVRFNNVVEKCPFKTTSWMIPKEYAESADLTILLQKIQDAGGVSERAFGGLLLVHLPPESTVDVQREYQRWYGCNK